MKVELNIISGVECPINLITEIALLFRSDYCRWTSSDSSNCLFAQYKVLFNFLFYCIVLFLIYGIFKVLLKTEGKSTLILFSEFFFPLQL